MRARIVWVGLVVAVTAIVPITRSEATPVVEIEAPTGVAQYATATVEFAPRYQPANPFDPDEVISRVVAFAPDGTARAYLAYWYQPFERALVDGREQLSPAGPPTWRVRVTPDVPGSWVWFVEGRDPHGRWATGARWLQVRASGRRGPLQRSPTSDRYLQFANGKPYFAVGENLSWYDARGTYAYDEWFDELAAAGGNFARPWMSSWAFGLEWNDTGLGDYSTRLGRAWQLDHVFEAARVRRIQLELVLLNHGAFSTRFNSEWATNPYNVANGGPLDRPQDFFTDPTAKRWFRQRLFYIVARWGAAPNLLAWEFWNEVDLTDGFDGPAVAAWHREMSDVIRFIDPHRHLISSSTAIFGNEENLWARGGLDFGQVHHYARIGDIPFLPDVSVTVPELTAIRRTQSKMPVLFAELGVDSRGPAETLVADPQGIGLHDGLWAGVVSGGFGTAMPWWWDSIVHPDWERYEPMYRAVASFVRGVRFDREGFEPELLPVANADAVTARALTGSTSLLVWVKDSSFQWTSPTERAIEGSSLQLELGTTQWCGRWIDTWTGVTMARVRDVSGTATMVVPRFTRDVALRLRHC
jgi:hypothetical protein